jgi:ribonuclease VapC
MVIDTSAFLAILQDEPDRRSFTEAIEAAAVRRTSAATFLEASMVVQSRYGAEGLHRLDRLIESAGIDVVAVDPAQARVARRAFGDFGKGRHPAGLNYGDCFAYALARQLGEPLLCKGDDFSRTDLDLVLPPAPQK